MDTIGAADGVPVFFMHGMPGSRGGPHPREIALCAQGVLLIAYDRPGYADSTRHKGRTVADAADDVRAIADRLGLERFAVAGRSAGGPHALAVAALLPDRVTAVGALVSSAPRDADLMDWSANMMDWNADTFALTERELAERLSETARQVENDPETFIQDILLDRQNPLDRDLHVVGDIDIRRRLKAVYRDALRSGPHGWIDDVLALQRDWDFEPAKIATPTFLWHGRNDRFSPRAHTYWLKSKIPHAQVEVASHLGHFGAFLALPQVLTWLVDRHREATLRPFTEAATPGPGSSHRT